MLLVLLLPGLSLYLHRRKGLGALFLLVQLTGIGWPVGSLLAYRNLKRQRLRRRRRSTSVEWSATAFREADPLEEK
jgi:hypothetical protein